MVNEFISENIKKIRNKLKISQSDLAERANISLRQLQRIEGGESTPPMETIEKISRALGVKVNELLIDYSAAKQTKQNEFEVYIEVLENEIASLREVIKELERSEYRISREDFEFIKRINQKENLNEFKKNLLRCLIFDKSGEVFSQWCRLFYENIKRENIELVSTIDKEMSEFQFKLKTKKL